MAQSQNFCRLQLLLWASAHRTTDNPTDGLYSFRPFVYPGATCWRGGVPVLIAVRVAKAIVVLEDATHRYCCCCCRGGSGDGYEQWCPVATAEPNRKRNKNVDCCSCSSVFLCVYICLDICVRVGDRVALVELAVEERDRVVRRHFDWYCSSRAGARRSSWQSSRGLIRKAHGTGGYGQKSSKTAQHRNILTR